MAVASLLDQKSGKGKGKVREQEENPETVRTDSLQGRRDQQCHEIGYMETRKEMGTYPLWHGLQERLS